MSTINLASKWCRQWACHAAWKAFVNGHASKPRRIGVMCQRTEFVSGGKLTCCIEAFNKLLHGLRTRLRTQDGGDYLWVWNGGMGASPIPCNEPGLSVATFLAHRSSIRTLFTASPQSASARRSLDKISRFSRALQTPPAWRSVAFVRSFDTQCHASLSCPHGPRPWSPVPEPGQGRRAALRQAPRIADSTTPPTKAAAPGSGHSEKDDDSNDRCS